MIKFDSVTKVYKTGVCANQDISFDVEKGTVVGIIGANGSGKTTLIRQLLQILMPTSGSISVDDKEEYMDLLSYSPQFSSTYPYLTVRDSIKLVLRYQKKDKKTVIKNTEKILEITGLDKMADQYTYTLSGGQTKLLSIACALASDKKYLILDEPTSMVDIVTKERIWTLLKEFKSEKGILLASHDMSEVKRLCDKVVILKGGKVVYSGTPDKIGEKCCIVTVTLGNMEKSDTKKCNAEKENADNFDAEKFDAEKYTKSCKFEVEEDCVKIVGTSVDSTLDALKEIEKDYAVKSMNCEYPAFYEGVLNLV